MSSVGFSNGFLLVLNWFWLGLSYFRDVLFDSTIMDIVNGSFSQILYTCVSPFDGSTLVLYNFFASFALIIRSVFNTWDHILSIIGIDISSFVLFNVSFVSMIIVFVISSLPLLWLIRLLVDYVLDPIDKANPLG